MCKSITLIIKIANGKKSKIIIFLLTIPYNGYGILQLGKQGKPCNAGIATIVLTPFLLILLATALSWLTFSSIFSGYPN